MSSVVVGCRRLLLDFVWLLLDAVCSVVGCCWLLLDDVGCCWMLLDDVGCCWMLLDVVGCCWMLMLRSMHLPFTYAQCHAGQGRENYVVESECPLVVQRL